MGLNPNREKKLVGTNSMGAGVFFQLQKIITRSIFVIDKKVTSNNLSEILFSNEKKLRGSTHFGPRFLYYWSYRAEILHTYVKREKRYIVLGKFSIFLIGSVKKK